MFLGVLPALTIVVTLFASTISDDAVAMDFQQFYAAAQAILDGESPYAEDGDA